MSDSYLLLLLTCVLFTCSSAQKSCRGRCGEAYSRGNACQCDYECLSHNECCRNYESTCTSRDSCKGRCGERFKRGRQCHCDIECVKFNQCCPDYETQCTLEDTALQPESAAASPQRTTSLWQNSQCNKPTEEEEDPEATTSPAEEDYDPEEEGITEGTPLPEIVSGSEPLPSTAPEDEEMDPTEIKPSVLPAETEPNELLNGSLEPEESSPPLPEKLSTPVPSTANSSTLLPTTRAPKDTTDMKDPPVPEEGPEEDPESRQVASEPENISPNSSAPTLSPEVTPTIPAITQQPTDQPPAPTSPGQAAGPNTTLASEQPEQDTQKKKCPQSTLETTTNPPTTVLSDNFAASNSTEPKPSSAEQNEDTLAQENKPGPQTEQPQSEASEKTTSEGVESHTLEPTEKPSAVETTKATENIEDPSPTKEPSVTPASVKVDPSPTKAPEKPTNPKLDIIPEGDPRDYQADANNDTNLCSGRPVNGLTTLRNGTLVVFRGHYFWTLDSRRNAGHPQRITDVWGIPSPIDTVYTRCNCQGKTYFFKGQQYWRFENGAMDPDFPRTIQEGFGLTGQITAALSMPLYRSRKESVFFFKKGGLAQRYTYRNTPQCGRSLAVHTLMKKVKRQADPELGQEIDTRKAWRDFPSTVTSAVSVRSIGGDGYKYYIFSKTKYYSLKMEADTPVILTPREGPGKQKSAKSWFRCLNS